MNKTDCDTCCEWIHLEVDGVLAAREAALLADHLGTCAACRREREEAEALGRLLRGSRLPVRPDFRSAVLSALPSTGWESRAPRSWVLPAAAMLLFAAAAMLLLSSSSLVLPPGVSALMAVGEMVRASMLAGVGLLGASWKGIGLIAREVVSSPLAIGVFGLLVLSVNLLLVSLIRRRRGSAVAALAARRNGGPQG